MDKSAKVHREAKIGCWRFPNWHGEDSRKTVQCLYRLPVNPVIASEGSKVKVFILLMGNGTVRKHIGHDKMDNATKLEKNELSIITIKYLYT